MLGPLVWVDLAEVIDHGEAKAFSDCVVICEAVVATSHDVQGSKVPPEKENMFSPDFIIVILLRKMQCSVFLVTNPGNMSISQFGLWKFLQLSTLGFIQYS